MRIGERYIPVYRQIRSSVLRKKEDLLKVAVQAWRKAGLKRVAPSQVNRKLLMRVAHNLQVLATFPVLRELMLEAEISLTMNRLKEKGWWLDGKNSPISKEIHR